MTIWRSALHAGYVRLQIHSGCVIFIVLPLQQWLHERASMLCHMYAASHFKKMDFNLYPVNVENMVST